MTSFPQIVMGIAFRVVETGIIDVILFSINAAYGESNGDGKCQGTDGFHYHAYKPTGRIWSSRLKDVGIKLEEFETMAHNAKDAIGGLFLCDRCELSIEDCVAIYEDSYR